MQTTQPSPCLSLMLLLVFPLLAAAQQNADAPNLAIKPAPQDAEWSKDWWQKRHEEKLKAVADSKDFELIFVGDSITHGFENTGKTTWETHYANRKALNLGFSGDRTENVLWRLQNGEVEGLKPKLIVMMIGTNNAGHRKDPPAHTAAGVKAILAEFEQRLPDAKILLLGIFPRGENSADEFRQLNDQTNKMIESYADNSRIVFLDIAKEFLDEKGSLPKDVMPDLLHPNEQGYEIWAKAMEPQIVKMLRD